MVGRCYIGAGDWFDSMQYSGLVQLTQHCVILSHAKTSMCMLYPYVHAGKHGQTCTACVRCSE